MVFARQLAVRFGDFGVGGVFGDTEDLIEILAQPFILSHDVPPFVRFSCSKKYSFSNFQTVVV